MSERERLALLAHELRSPVAALEALVHAAPGVTATEVRRGLLARALAAARDLERLLSDPDLLSLRLEPVDLVATARALATDRVSVRGEGRLLVRADETRLRQALANLVANGLRHGTRVELAVEARHGSVVVEVTDDGPGFDVGADPFARGTSGVGSSGLGLWLSRAIVEAHGGSLELVPGPSQGATLRLALPSASGEG